jgi:hypothetical protein
LEPKVWDEGTFKPSQTCIESLEAELSQSDFAVLTLTADDQSLSRGEISVAPRDNVLFELGLFMGRLGRERVYYLYDARQELKIPTDLLGVIPAKYELRDGQALQEAFANPCSSIAERMTQLGVRNKYVPDREVMDFCRRITGSWWGRQWLSDGEDTRLALFQIILDSGANTLRLDGETFDKNGKLFGRWRSIAMGLRSKERTLLWAWEGTHPALAPGETFAGFGHYTFDDATDVYERADGQFADIQQGRKKAVRWTSVQLRRVDIADLERITRVMKSGSDSARAAEVIKAIDSFTRAGGQGI